MYQNIFNMIENASMKMFCSVFLQLRATIEDERREKKRRNRFVTITLFLLLTFFRSLSLSHSLFYLSNNVVSCFRLDKYTYTHQMKNDQSVNEKDDAIFLLPIKQGEIFYIVIQFLFLST